MCGAHHLKRLRAISGSVATIPVAYGPSRIAGTLSPKRTVVRMHEMPSEIGPHAKRPPILAEATREG